MASLNRLARWVRLACLLGAFAGTLALMAIDVRAAGESSGDYAPGQLLIKLRGDASLADAQDVAAKLQMQVIESLPVRGWYQLEVLPSQTSSVRDLEAEALEDARVAACEPNYYRRPLEATPNDRYWSSLWGMRMINMPAAWSMQLGSSAIRVAVIDSGVEADHPDLAGRVLQGYDVSDGDADASPDMAAQEGSHGTHVAGTIAAQGNNGVGVVGVCWNGVRIIPLKIFPNSTVASLVTALDIAQNGRFNPTVLRAHVVNMSIGGTYSQAEDDKLGEAEAAGVLLVAAAGNDSGPVAHPGASEHVIGVSALNSSGYLATYSNFGPEIDIAAPGGQTATASPMDSGGILSTTPGWGYESFQGTSMACPHVAGAAALLMSAGMSAGVARDALLATARPKGVPTPNDLYGYGVLDVYKALQYPGSAISINNPRQGDVISTLKPLIEIRLPGVTSDTVSVAIDGDTAISRGVVADSRVADYQFSSTTGSMVFSWQFSYNWPCPTTPGAAIKDAHTIIVGTSSGQTTQITFSIQPVVLFPGQRYMFSYPVASDSTDPSSLLGTSLVRQARAVTSVVSPGIPFISYAYYNYAGLATDAEASLQPPSVYVEEVYGSLNTLPRGLGYWLDYRGASPRCVFANKVVDHRYLYEVDLKAGWNQIGNPYPFPIPWSTARFRYLGEWLSVSDAVQRGWIGQAIYRYENGGYSSFTAPSGMMEPWVGYWIKVRKPASGILLTSVADPRATMTLIFSPVRNEPAQANVYSVTSGPLRLAGEPSSVQTSASRRIRPDRRRSRGASAGEWQISFKASQTGRSSNSAAMGMSYAATDGYDAKDMELPPPADSSPVAAFIHSEWGPDSGWYSSDIRNLTTGQAVWMLGVSTYEPGGVDLTWGNLSRMLEVYNVEMTDLATGSQVDFNRASYHYSAPHGASQRMFQIRITRKSL